MRKFIIAMFVLASPISLAEMTPVYDALALARRVAERPANEGRGGTMHFALKNKAGRMRHREALMIHSEQADTTRIAIYFTAPGRIEDTAFLSYDHVQSTDENWLFLPATERVRRLPTSDRGDYFLGTDLTYGDIKDNFKFSLDDWEFSVGGSAQVNGRELPVLTGTARSSAIAEELGYAAFTAVVDIETGFPLQIDYRDTRGKPLKHVEVRELDLIGGAWTALDFVVSNAQSGHETHVQFSDMRHVPDLDMEVLEPTSLEYGVPDVE